MNENIVSQEETREVDLSRLVRAVWSRAWIVAVVSILSMVLVFLLTFFFVTPKYEAHAMFYVNNSSISMGDASISLSSSDITASKSLVDTYIVILDTWETQQDVIDYAGVNLTTNQFMDMVSSTAVNETEVFRVTITSEDPVEAEKLANAVAYILPKRIGTIVEGTSAQIVSSARTPSKPSSPNYIVNSLVGFILGFVLSVGIIALREWLDITIRTEGDVLQSSNLPLLAKVPDMGVKSKSGYYGYGKSRKKKEAVSEKKAGMVGDGVSFAASEAYKMLRTKIEFSFTDDKTCPVIGVSSAMAGEGKSLTAANLAYSLAQLEKKVLLIDCDMRRPSLAEKLSIQKHPGLSNYLIGKASLDKVTQTVGSGFMETTLKVITAGKNPPNPMELLRSEKMERTVAKLRETYDFIVLDLPPVGEVSDALAVAKMADGVILVACQDYGTRVALRNAVNQFEFIGTKLLGVVMNRASDRKKKYGYRNYYKHYYKNYGYYSHYDSYESSYEDAMQKTLAEQTRKKR